MIKIKRLFRVICLRLVTHMPMSGLMRTRLTSLGGVNVLDFKHTTIGEGCIFDSLHPENITIGHKVRITMRCVVLTHYIDASKNNLCFNYGKVTFKDNCFIGANVLICHPVTIGENSIVGAGAVVTKDIPDNEIWGGVPAHFIKKRP